MIFIAGANFIDALLDPLSVIVRMVSVRAEAVSLSAGARPVEDSFNAKVVIDISTTVPVAASSITTTGADFTILGSSVEV